VSHQKSVAGCVRHQQSVDWQDLYSLTKLVSLPNPTNVPVA